MKVAYRMSMEAMGPMAITVKAQEAESGETRALRMEADSGIVIAVQVDDDGDSQQAGIVIGGEAEQLMVGLVGLLLRLMEDDSVLLGSAVAMACEKSEELQSLLGLTLAYSMSPESFQGFVDGEEA